MYIIYFFLCTVFSGSDCELQEVVAHCEAQKESHKALRHKVEYLLNVYHGVPFINSHVFT